MTSFVPTYHPNVDGLAHIIRGHWRAIDNIQNITNISRDSCTGLQKT